ncbi:MAG: BNR/Asp-box repeat protein [Candidatus Eremiobacteraeota bacterium]|nr:BNR/Asp-box repeat protein [Candidatus Eremiobacteraeota bacterium]
MIRLGVALCAALIALPAAAGADPTSTALTGLSYRSIGPAIAGGRTTAVAGSDRDPAVYYAGGAGGGVFKSVDGGASWRAVFDREAVAPIGAIAVSPRDANDVWVGTGEANPRNDVEEGAGIWHSTDGGKRWQHAGLDDAGSISSLSIDPRDPRVVVAAVLGHVFRDSTTRGVYVTRDGGAHWKRTLYLGPASGASDVVRVPDRPSTLFAGMWQFRRQPWTMTSGGPRGGLFRSDDNGVSWRKLSGSGLPSGLTGRIGIATGTGGRVYAIVQSGQGDIWRSDDGGRKWRAMPHASLVGARGFYFSRVYVDPTNANRVMNVNLILSMSADGARTFKPVATEAGWDYHANWWSRDGRRVINGNDEGVILSYDGGRHWSQPYDLPFAQPYHVAFDDAVPSYHVCIGLQDNNSWCGPSTSDNGIGVLNRDWAVIGPGDGMWNVFDPGDRNLVWNSTTNNGPGQVYIYDARTHQQHEVSPDARIKQEAASALPYRFNWDTPLAFTNDGKALAGGNVLFQTADHGGHWTVVSPDLTRNEKSHQGIPGGPISEDASGAEMGDTILNIATTKLSDGQIWIGTDDGLVQLTRDGGATWKNVTPAALPEWGRVYGVEPGHRSAATAYVAVDRHMSGDDRPYLFVTDDFGATWNALAGDLPADAFVRAIREDPREPNLLYAGTRRGVFASFDRGRHWHALRLNMPATAIYDLQVQPQANDLVVAAHGRGVWILDDLAPLQAWTRAQSSAFTLFVPRDAYRMWRAAPINVFLDGSLPAGEFAGGNRPYGAPFTYYLARPAKSVALAILDPRGRVVRHLPAKHVSKHAGMNRATWDLAEDGPVRWSGTFLQNRGPEVGAEAVPGTYTVRLTVDGVAQEQPVVVKADPRDPASADDAARRHAFLAACNAELSRVDQILNRIDAQLKRDRPGGATALRALRSRLTLDPQNIEDLRTAPRLRERILDLLSRVGGTSFQVPNAAHEEEASKVRTEYEASIAAYEALMAR